MVIINSGIFAVKESQIKPIEPEIVPRISYAELRGTSSPAAFIFKVLGLIWIAIFLAFVVMICFPISALTTLGTVTTTTGRMGIMHLFGKLTGRISR